jgi:hypothetical protein
MKGWKEHGRTEGREEGRKGRERRKGRTEGRKDERKKGRKDGKNLVEVGGDVLVLEVVVVVVFQRGLFLFLLGDAFFEGEGRKEGR